MRKKGLTLALAAVLAGLATTGVSAHYDGMKEPEHYNIPEVNKSNPAIVIDGVMDAANGEWNGALKYTMDYTVSEENERLWDFTVWSPEVWGVGSFSLSTPEDLPENWQPAIDNYFLWSGDGVYICTTYKSKLNSDTVNESRKDAFIDYYGLGKTDTYDFGLPANVQHMILPTDDPSAGISTDGKWFYLYSTDDKTSVWTEDYTYYNSNSESELLADIQAVGYQTPEPDADGYYTYTYEMFIPWTFLNLANYENADTTMYDFYGDEGLTVQIGLIVRLRNTPSAEDASDLPYIQFTDSKGWSNFNYYTLTGKAADYNGTSEYIVADPANQFDPSTVTASASTTTASSEPTMLWDFGADEAMSEVMGANGNNGISFYGENDYYTFIAVTNDPHVSVEMGAESVEDIAWVKTRVYNPSSATAIELFGATDGRGLTGPECTHIDIKPATEEWVEYYCYIPTANVETANAFKGQALEECYWTGEVNWIRLDPMWHEGDDGSDSGGSMEAGEEIWIDYIAFFKTEEEAKAYAGPSGTVAATATTGTFEPKDFTTDCDGTAMKTDVAPVIDGEIDDVWNIAEALDGSENPGDLSGEGISGYTKLMWDKDALYILCVVEDDTISANTDVDVCQDSVDIWVSEANTGSSEGYGVEDGDYCCTVTPYGPRSSSAKDNRTIATKMTDTGYIVECRIEWTGVSDPQVGHVMGHNVSYNNELSGDDTRDSWTSWQFWSGMPYWESPFYCATVELVDGSPRAKAEEAPAAEETPAAAEEAPAAEETPVEEAPVEETPAAEEEAPVEEAPAEADAEAPAAEETKAAKSNTGLIIGIVAAVVVLGGGAGIIAAKKKK